MYKFQRSLTLIFCLYLLAVFAIDSFAELPDITKFEEQDSEIHPGSVVTIVGDHFGKFDSEKSKVKFGETDAEILHERKGTQADPVPIWEEKRIKVRVPIKVKKETVNVKVESTNGTSSPKQLNLVTSLIDSDFKDYLVNQAIIINRSGISESSIIEQLITLGRTMTDEIDGPAITVNLKSPLEYNLNKGEFKEIPSFDSAIGSSDVRLINADGSEKARFEQLSVQLHKSQEPSSKFIIEGSGIIKIPATEIDGVSMTFQNIRLEDSGEGLKLTKINGVSSLEWNSLRQYIEKEAMSHLRSQLPGQGQLFNKIDLVTTVYSNGRIEIQNVELRQPASGSNEFGYSIGGVVRADRRTLIACCPPLHWESDSPVIASFVADGVITAKIPVNRPLMEAGMEFNILIKNIKGNVDLGSFFLSYSGPFNSRDLNYALPQAKLPLPLKDKTWLGNIRLNSSAIRGGVGGKIEVSISASE